MDVKHQKLINKLSWAQLLFKEIKKSLSSTGKTLRSFFEDDINSSDHITIKDFRSTLLISKLVDFDEYLQDINTLIQQITNDGEEKSFEFSILELAIMKYAKGKRT